MGQLNVCSPRSVSKDLSASSDVGREPLDNFGSNFGLLVTKQTPAASPISP